MSEIKPCPFCGSNDLDTVFVDMRDREGRPMQVVCADCGASGPSAYFSDDSTTIGEVVRVTAWNRRAAPEPAPGDRERAIQFAKGTFGEDAKIEDSPFVDRLAAEFAKVREEQKEMDAKIADGMIDRNDAGKIDHDDIGSITALDIRDAIRRGEP